MRMVITDLDGTLLKNDRTLSAANSKTLQKLGKLNIPRVVATGRSLFSAHRVMNDDFPIDYLIFSTGAGILNWKTKELLYKNCISPENVSRTLDYLIESEVCFMLHKEIPDNHYFFYHQGKIKGGDYDIRLHLYRDYAEPFSMDKHRHLTATQFISTLGNIDDFLMLKNLLQENVRYLSFTKTTSPLDGVSVWLELFNKGVNKSKSASYLSQILDIGRDDILVVGNDWNDEDMLEWGGDSYLVSNAPCDLRKSHKLVKSNEEDGFTQAVQRWLK